MQLSELTVEVRDKSLKRLGQIHPRDLDLTAEIDHLGVGKWKLTVAPTHPLAGALRTPGSGLIVQGPADVLFSGPSIAPTYSASKENPYGQLVVEGVTDEIHMADRTCFTDPTTLNLNAAAHDVRTGSIEDLMHAYVNANAGPGAIPVRRVSKLTMGTNGHRGATVTQKVRLKQLDNLLAELGTLGGFGYRVVQRGTVLVFETYQVLDRTANIRLDIWNNTLASNEVAITAPTATQVVVAGQGEQEARAFYIGSNTTAAAAETAWGRRIEKFVDQRQTDDPNEYVSKANEVLTDEGLTKTAVKAVPIESTTMRFGVHWFLGDKIAAVIDNGEYSATVTAVVLSVNKDGLRMALALGDPSRLTVTRQLIQRIVSTERRLALLERGV